MPWPRSGGLPDTPRPGRSRCVSSRSALRCPFRLTELARLTVPEVDFARRRAQLVESKTGPRWVPLTKRSCVLLREQIASLPFGERRVWARKNGAALDPGSMSHAWTRIRRQFAEVTKNTELADVRLSRLASFHVHAGARTWSA